MPVVAPEPGLRGRVATAAWCAGASRSLCVLTQGCAPRVWAVGGQACDAAWAGGQAGRHECNKGSVCRVKNLTPSGGVLWADYWVSQQQQKISDAVVVLGGGSAMCMGSNDSHSCQQ
jgi:hypothetical protein